MGESQPENISRKESSSERNDLDTSILSKRQIKKLKRKAQWEEKKVEKRRKEREKNKLKRCEAVAKGLPTRTGPSRKELKRNKAVKSPNDLKIAVDLDYDDLMIEKDVAKCVKQLLRIYTVNRRSHMPVTLFFTGIKEHGRVHEALKKNDGYENWDVQWVFDSYSNRFDKNEIIYLTSDSDEVLDVIDPKKTYIIGGLVDHNHHKGICLERAQQLSLKTARLPLSEYVEMKTRTVLSTYHVFEILLRLSEGNSWTDALLGTIPMRKGAKAKEPSVKEITEVFPKYVEQAVKSKKSPLIETMEQQTQVENCVPELSSQSMDCKEKSVISSARGSVAAIAQHVQSEILSQEDSVNTLGTQHPNGEIL